MFAKIKEQKTEKRKESLPESISGIASVLVSGLFIITFMVQAFEIPSESMVKTLLVGDHVFVDRLSPTAKAGPGSTSTNFPDGAWRKRCARGGSSPAGSRGCEWTRR